MKSPRGPLKSGIVTLLVVMSSFALFPRSNRVSLRVFIWASKCAVKRRHRNTISMCRAVAKGEARCKVSLHTKIFTYMCVKLHRHQWTISLKCTWLAMLRTHPKIVGVKGRKGEGFCTRSDVPTRSAALSPSAHVTHDRVCAAMLAVVTKPSLCVMRPVTQMHARKAMRTRTHQHAHKTPNAHFSFFFFFAEAMCWDGDRGLAVGRQTADAVLWHQTFQFRISLSCLLTLSLSRARARTRLYPQTQQRSFPLISLPKLKDFEGLTQPGEHVHTSVFPSTEKWIQFHQPLLKRALWDAQTRFLCDSKYSFPLLRHRWSFTIFPANR